MYDHLKLPAVCTWDCCKARFYGLHYLEHDDSALGTGSRLTVIIRDIDGLGVGSQLLLDEDGDV